MPTACICIPSDKGLRAFPCNLTLSSDWHQQSWDGQNLESVNDLFEGLVSQYIPRMMGKTIFLGKVSNFCSKFDLTSESDNPYFLLLHHTT